MKKILIAVIFLSALFVMSEAGRKKRGVWKARRNAIVENVHNMNENINILSGEIEVMENQIEELEATCGCEEEPVQPSCPDGWSEFQGSCFMFVETMMTWSHAKDNCNNLGGFLAEASDAETDNFLASFISPHGSFEDGPWLGASDLAREGQWIWENSQNHMSYKNWNSVEPNGGISENCLHYRQFNLPRWNDSRCEGSKHASVCQRQLNSSA